MKIFVAVSLLGTLINNSTSMIHTVRIYDTFSSGLPNFPEFVAVVVVNDMEVMRCDSLTKRAEPKQPWVNRVTEDDPKFWEWLSQVCVTNMHTGKDNVERARRQLNRPEGVHLWQRMCGCEWDDETDEVTGYYQYAFDGEDFISLDLSTETWVAAKPQAFATKLRWEKNGETERKKFYIHHIFAKWLKNIVRYGEDTLKRTVLPEVSLLQKSSSSPVTCHATGFYPDRAMLFWTKDGEELEDFIEILPNRDGTFQSFVDLDLSSVPAEDWDKFSCVFQLSGVKEQTIITKLERDKIRTNAKSPKIAIISGLLVLGAAVVIAAAAVALVVVRKGRAKKNSPDDSLRQTLSPAEQVTNSEGSSTSSQDNQEMQRLNLEAAEAEAPEGQ